MLKPDTQAMSPTRPEPGASGADRQARGAANAPAGTILTVSKRMAACLRWYAQPFPRPASRSGEGWGSKTVDEALGRGLLHVGPHGAHDLTAAGREALKHAE